MKEENIKKLEKELKYLLKEERDKEITKYEFLLANENINIKGLAEKIYYERGIDYKKLQTGLFNNLSSTFNTFSSLIKSKDPQTRKKMIFELIYIVLVLSLIKLPFDFIRDIGYNYLDILGANHTIDLIWQLIFLILYTITLIVCLVMFIKNFNNKYKN